MPFQVVDDNYQEVPPGAVGRVVVRVKPYCPVGMFTRYVVRKRKFLLENDFKLGMNSLVKVCLSSVKLRFSKELVESVIKIVVIPVHFLDVLFVIIEYIK